MKQILSLIILTAIPPVAVAAVLQFGVVNTGDFKAGAPLPEGNGYGSNTYVIINLGTAIFPLADLTFTSSLISTTTPIVPFTGTTKVTPPITVLSPGGAYGYINNGFNQSLTLSYLQSLVPSVTSLVMASSSFQADLDNPTGSGVTFADTQTVVSYMLRFDGATAQWQGSWEMGYPGLMPGITSGTVGYTQSNAVTVPGDILPI